jgi:hypothetical protein
MRSTASEARPQTWATALYAIAGTLGLITFVRLLIAADVGDSPLVEGRAAAPLGHLLGSAAVAAAAALTTSALGWPTRRIVGVVAAGAVVFSVGTEVGQLFVAGRTASIIDGAVNVTGALLGAGAVLFGLSRPGLDRFVGPTVVIGLVAWTIAGNLAL